MNPFQEYAIEDVIITAIAVVVLFSWVIAILYSIWWGFLMITSWGNEEKIKPAVNHIRHALLGLFALVLVLFIAPKVLSLFWLPYADTITATNVFSRIGNLSSYVFSRPIGDGPAVLTPDAPSSLPSDFSDL
jgi:hypothetical protein